MKQVLAWTFIVGGFLIGLINIVYGAKRAKKEESKFSLFAFIKKGFRRTPIEEFTGYERIGLGIVSIFGGALIYLLVFKH